VGSPPDFQGDERDVIFASMVIAERRRAVTARDWQRRYNVAASRARDQLWLFHSVTLDDLAPTDLRRSLLAYAQSPPAPPVHHGLDDVGWDSERRDPFESKFHQRVFVALRDKGYRVEPQVEVNGRRIDLVVTGSNARLAVECDSDHWHARRDDQLADLDHELQLRRAGWQFWRVRESEFHLDADEALASLWPMLAARGIEPGDWARPTLANATSVRWEAVALSDEEGLDGLDGADPAALDLEVGEPLLQ
jgi:very-short-patch-repair endonuclease